MLVGFADFANYLVSYLVSSDLTFHQRKKLMHDMKSFFWDEAFSYRSFADGNIRRCVHEIEMLNVLEACHSLHMGGTIVVSKLHIRSCSVCIICQQFTKMLMISPNHVIGANEMEGYQKRKSFP